MNISDFLNNQYADSALYMNFRNTPSFIDGLKNSSRKIVHTIKETNQKKLQESKTARSSEIENLQIKLEKAESEINRLTEAKQRISKLPFNVTSANLKYENMNPSQLLSSDDEALFNTMVNMNRK